MGAGHVRWDLTMASLAVRVCRGCALDLNCRAGALIRVGRSSYCTVGVQIHEEAFFWVTFVYN